MSEIPKKEYEDFDDTVLQYTKHQRHNIIRAFLTLIYFLHIEKDIYRALK